MVILSNLVNGQDSIINEESEQQFQTLFKGYNGERSAESLTDMPQGTRTSRAGHIWNGRRACEPTN